MAHRLGALQYELIGKFGLFVIGTMVFAYFAYDLGHNKAGEQLSKIEVLETIATTQEFCVPLDIREWYGYDDRKPGAIDTYTPANTPGLGVVPAEDVNAYGLYFSSSLNPIGGIWFTGSWDIEYWKITCEDESGKAYTIVNVDYSKLLDKGYLHANYTTARTHMLIDMTKTGYKPEYKCKKGVKAEIKTHDIEWEAGEGTDENVDLCYYRKSKRL